MVQVARALMAAPTDRHWGYQLRQQTGLTSGVLHPILHRMRDEGWLTPADDDGDGGAAPRVYYSLTEFGREQLADVLDRARAAPRFAVLFNDR